MRTYVRLGLLLAVVLAALLPQGAARGQGVVVATIGVGDRPAGVAINTNTNRIYISNSLSDNVSVVDGATNTEIGRIPVGSAPAYMAINLVTGRLFVPNELDNTISEVDVATSAEVHPRIAVSGSKPVSVEVNPNRNYVYVVNQNSNDVSVIDAGARTEIHVVPVGTFPTGAAFNPLTERLYVANPNSNSVSVIDGVSFSVLDTVTGLSSPQDAEVDVARNLIYVTNHTTHEVSVIDGTTNEEIDIDGDPANGVTRIPVGNGPGGLGYNPSTETYRIYVASQIDHTVSVIDAATWSVVGSPIGVGPAPSGEVEANPVTNRVYVPTGFDNKVWVIAEPSAPVGGIVEIDVGGSDAPASAAEGSGSSAPPYAALAGGVAAVLVALSAGAWYARKRWLS